MTLKELINEKTLSSMQADGATYKEYYSAVLKKFGKKSIKELSKDERKELDNGWKAKDE